jgi:hypothetical protein
MLAANEIKQETKSIIILNKVFKYLPLFLPVEIISPHNHLRGLGNSRYVNILELLLLVSDALCTPSESLNKLL